MIRLKQDDSESLLTYTKLFKDRQCRIIVSLPLLWATTNKLRISQVPIIYYTLCLVTNIPVTPAAGLLLNVQTDCMDSFD